MQPAMSGFDRDNFVQIQQYMNVGVICEGVVEMTSPANNTCTVRLKNIKAPPVQNCVWAAGIISGMAGFKTSYVPPVKTEVLIVNLGHQPIYIVGCSPGQPEDLNSGSRTTTVAGQDYSGSQKFNIKKSLDQPVFARHKPPIDLAEGEVQIDNMLGVGLTMLRGLARLQASGLAAIECHIMDDMVRIVSDTFRHYTAFGDYEIKNDGGRLNVIWNGTSHDHEAWGITSPDQAKAALNGNRVDQTPELDADGRWRFSQYIGWLGDFINAYVTDPQEQLGKIGQFRSGKARLHINTDGSVLVQSVADIVLEKVVRIPVPIRVKVEGDPTDNSASEQLDAAPLKTWTPGANLFEMVFQLRDYARWLNNQYSLGRFRMQKKRYQIPTEAETPAPKMLSGEADREASNKDAATNWRMTYSTIRIYRDGSIQTLDSYGNSFTTTKTGIMLSSTADITIEAAGSLNLVAGRDINLLAKKSISISAIQESIRLKAASLVEVFSAGVISLFSEGAMTLKALAFLDLFATASVAIRSSGLITLLTETVMNLFAGAYLEATSIGVVSIQSGEDTSITSMGGLQMTSETGDAVISSQSGTGTFSIEGAMRVGLGNVGSFTVSSAGNVDVMGTLTANVLNGTQNAAHAGGHVGGTAPVPSVITSTPVVIPAIPAVPPAPVIPDAKLSAGSAQAYQTMSQQHIVAEGLNGYQLWDMSALKVGGKTVPWPSAHSVFGSVTKLNTPSSAKEFAHTASALVQKPNGMQVLA